LVVLAVLAVGGCDRSAPAEPADPPASGTPPAVRFDADVRAGADALRISYGVTNQSGEDLIVLNRVPAYSSAGSPRADVNAVYVTGAGPAGRVQISKRAFPMPETDSVAWAMAPRISGVLLRPGRSVGEDLVVAMPLRRHHPYGDDVGEGRIRLPDPIRETVFCVGVLRRADAPADLATSGPSGVPSGAAASVPSDVPGGSGEGDGSVTLPHLSAVTDVQYLSCSAPLRW
jgi:hypothetical protein